MRPFLALVLAALILGLVQAYMAFQAAVTPPRVEQTTSRAEGKFSLDITLTFDAAGDDFTPESLVVMLAGNELLRKTERISAGTPILIADAPGLAVGKNEFFIQAGTPGDSPAIARAVRVRVLRDGVALTEQTLWSEPGEPVAGTIVVEVPAARLEHGDEH